jgi:hypothetical protein
LTDKNNNTAKKYNTKYPNKKIIGFTTAGQRELYDYIYNDKIPLAVNLPVFMVLAEELVASIY